ncbi:hypothetical protein HK405_015862, partial [Cladochytrium tenue]
RQRHHCHRVDRRWRRKVGAVGEGRRPLQPAPTATVPGHRRIYPVLLRGGSVGPRGRGGK